MIVQNQTAKVIQMNHVNVIQNMDAFTNAESQLNLASQQKCTSMIEPTKHTS